MSTDEELRLVFVGKTGVGKSATANAIAQVKGLFESAPDGKAVTVTCQCEKAEFQGQKLLLADSPGLFDTSKSQDEIKREIGRFTRLTAPGPHAVLLIMSAASRFTEEEINVIKKLQEMFGKGIENYIIIIITRTENWEEDDMTAEKFLEKLPPEAKEILQMPLAAGRHVAFQNRLRDGDPRKIQQVEELLELIKTTVRRNGNRCYTAELWRQAEEEMKSRQEEIKAKELAEEMKKVEEMERRFRQEIEEKFTRQMEELKAEMSKEREERERAANAVERQREREMTLKLEEMRLRHNEQMRADANEVSRDLMKHEVNLAKIETQACESRMQDIRHAREEAERTNRERIALEYRRLDDIARERARQEEANSGGCVVS